MSDQPIPQVVVQQTPPAEATWSVKEVFADLKGDLIQRFNNVDGRLESIDRRIDSTATKEDISEIHHRIDGVEARIVPLEKAAESEQAIEQNRARFRTGLAWAAGVASACAICASVVIPLVH